jgi:peptidoglycan/xylan/chitin deacetylase (PgdA/CDA1 family)
MSSSTLRTVRVFAALSILCLILAAGKTAAKENNTLRRVRVPILMYHYISDLPADADEIRRDLTVIPAHFRAQMQYLKAQGYSTISLYQLYDALTKGAALPAKPIVLTFDDGYLDAYTNVFPTLQQSGFTGTFFIITGKPDNNAPGYMNWAQIKQMADAGMSIEAHTKSHADLRGRTQDFLVYEILGSLQSIEAHTGHAPRMFAYPSGRYDAETLRVLRQLPVWMAVTTEHGDRATSTDLLLAPRLRIHGDTGVAGLGALLKG